ncbi:MAG: type 1 glutamine amidotransferase domain-containing protein [Bacteroidales bacterium]
MSKRALFILTSHDRLGDTGRSTGFYYEELATPYWALADAGVAVDIASIAGGTAPHDPGSLGAPGTRPASVERFVGDSAAMHKVRSTLAVEEVRAEDYDAIFLPGGHGTMWDLPTSTALAALLGRAFDLGKVIGAVCHGPAGLVGAKRADGKPIVADLRVNAFTDAEERAVGLTQVVPFLLESRLRQLGARFECGGNFQCHAVRDGQLVTGQNPMSSAAVAAEMLAALGL